MKLARLDLGQLTNRIGGDPCRLVEPLIEADIVTALDAHARSMAWLCKRVYGGHERG